MTVTISGLDGVRDLMRQIPITELNNVKKAINDTARAVQRDIVNKATLGRPYLYARTGALWRSVKQTPAVGNSISEVRGTVYTNIKYAPIQELGGTVKAKNKFLKVPGGPYLAIPLDANKTKAGVTRFSCYDAFNTLGAVIRKTKTGKWFIGIDEYGSQKGKPKKGSRKKIIGQKNVGGKKTKLTYQFIPYFVLKQKVTIPPRFHFRRSLDLNIPYFKSRLQDILDGIPPR